MIGIYTQGSKSLGLGHLSRIVPLYKYLVDSKYYVSLYLYGDDLAKKYLALNDVKFTVTSNFNKIDRSIDYWIIDSTKIWESDLYELIGLKNNNMLLSPKFNELQLKIINKAFLRSDPFNLPLKNKNISSKYFFFNDGRYIISQESKCLGIALSGSSNKNILSKIVELIINDQDLSKKIGSLKVFTGGNGSFLYDKKEIESYGLDIYIIDSLKSLWLYVNDVDLMIVGNGIIVDECISKNMNFIIFDINDLGYPKSMSKELASSKYTSDLDSLRQKLIEQITTASTKSESYSHRKENVFKEIISSFR